MKLNRTGSLEFLCVFRNTRVILVDIFILPVLPTHQLWLSVEAITEQYIATVHKDKPKCREGMQGIWSQDHVLQVLNLSLEESDKSLWRTKSETELGI